MMINKKKERLKAFGWQVGDTSEFLELTPEQIEFIDFKLALSQYLKKLRISQNISQESLAKKIKSSQSRIAKMEACDVSVSVDLILKTMFSLGATNQDIIAAINEQNLKVSPSSQEF